MPLNAASAAYTPIYQPPLILPISSNGILDTYTPTYKLSPGLPMPSNSTSDAFSGACGLVNQPPLDLSSRRDDTSEEILDYICKECPCRFTSRESSVSHVRREHCIEPKVSGAFIFEQRLNFLCSLCDAKYSVKYDCICHIINVHSVSQCKYCWMLIKNKNLKSHEKDHIVNGTEIYACKRCEYRTIDKKGMENHIKTFHFIHYPQCETYTIFVICQLCHSSIQKSSIECHAKRCKLSTSCTGSK